MNDPALLKTTNGNGDGPSLADGLIGWLMRLFKSGNGENSARDVLEELIEERINTNEDTIFSGRLSQLKRTGTCISA